MSSSLSVLGRKSWSFGVLGVLTTGLLSGCGSAGKPVGGNPPVGGDTSVSVILTSTSNDFTTDFLLQLQSLTLTNQAGQAVTLFTGTGTTPITEFVHLNGATEPYVTATIPQGVYTAASATVYTAQFTCVTNLQDGLNDSTYSQPQANVTIDVADTITVGPDAMGVVLNLQVAKSETYESCVPTGGSSFSIQPTFEMTAAEFGSPNTALANGNPGSFRGMISSVGTKGSFIVNNADGPPLTIVTQPSTTYQGVSSAAALTAGTQVDVDTVFGTNGALLATRIEVDDTNTNDLNVFSGPIVQVPNAVTRLSLAPQQQYGFITQNNPGSGAAEFDYTNAVFQTSGELTNLSTLPFTPTFTADTMVPGQNVSLTSNVPPTNGIVPVTTATLKPQTINGTIASVTTLADFQVYTVTLAPYDLFPDLALQAGQNQLISQPNNVQVYVSSYTLNATSSTLGVGNLLRFRGMIFNNTGTLAMDCSEVEPGVAE